MRKALVLLLFTAQICCTIPAFAQTGTQPVHLQVYLFNKKTGAAVPGETVYFEQSRTAGCPTGAAAKATTNTEGIADIYGTACIGEGVLLVLASENFPGGTAGFVHIVRGQAGYEFRVPISPMDQTDINSKPSNKFFNQDRVLHIRVVGREGGKLVPAHYAEIFDQQGNKIATTNFNGVATVKHKEVVGETVTLHAVPSPATAKEGWVESSASYIVGASEGTVRTTIPEDHITIVLNGNNTNVEKHPLDIIVRGSKPSSPYKCKCIRVAGAKILDAEGHVLGLTNGNGVATVTVEVPLGEEYTIRVEAKHWITASERLQSGSVAAGATSTYAHEHAEIMLQPNTNEQGNITVEVLDRETDKPIGGAAVTLYRPDHFPGTFVSGGETDAEGNSTFDAEEADRAMLNGEARIGVKHHGYQSAVQTVAFGSEHYVVYLKEGSEQEGPAALSAGTPKLVGAIPRGWTMTTSSVSYSYRSRPQSQKDTIMKGSWHVPTSIPAKGAMGSLTVTATGGDLDGTSMGLGVTSSDNSGLIHCAGIKSAGPGSGCLEGDHAAVSASVDINGSKTVTQTFWIKPNGRGGTISVTLPNGVHCDYVFKVSGHAK